MHSYVMIATPEIKILFSGRLPKRVLLCSRQINDMTMQYKCYKKAANIKSKAYEL